MNLKQLLIEKVLRNCYYYGYVAPSLSITSRHPIGTNVFEKEWDLLILLDTCRVDAITQFAEDYEFLSENPESITSVGSTSSEWIAHTFSNEYIDEIKNTCYISANGHAKYVLEEGRTPEEIEDVPGFTKWNTCDSQDLASIEHLWKHDSEGPGHTRPSIVTDRTVQLARSNDFDRMIVHYSQPHAPYASRVISEGGEMEDHEEKPFRYLINGGNKQKVMRSYHDNLRFVLNSVQKLSRNIDAPKTVISADHGEAFGEWSFYGHEITAPLPQIKRVPWVECEFEDHLEYKPEVELNDSSHSVSQHLEALGYK